MVLLGGVEGLERSYLGRDLLRESLGLIELIDIGLCDALLLVAGGENRAAVLRAGIGALAIDFGGIVRDGEVDFEELAVSDLRGIVGNLDGFSVASAAAAHGFVLRCALFAARITGDYSSDAFNIFEDGIDAPEAAAGENCGFRTFLYVLVDCCVWKVCCFCKVCCIDARSQ